jgi:hypothetical protein
MAFMKSLLHVFLKPFSAHHMLAQMSMLPFLQFLAPLIGGATSALGGLGSALGGAMGTLGGAGGIGGLLSKLPILGQGGLGLGKALGGITGANGLGGLLSGIGGNVSKMGENIGQAGVGKGGQGSGMLGRLFGTAPTAEATAVDASKAFVDPTRPQMGPHPQHDQNGDGIPDYGPVQNGYNPSGDIINGLLNQAMAPQPLPPARVLPAQQTLEGPRLHQLPVPAQMGPQQGG